MGEAAHRWAAGRHAVTALMGTRFPRAAPRQRVTAYVQGLLCPLGRKNGWQLAEQAGAEPPWGRPPLLGRAAWFAAEVREALRAYVVHHLSDPRAVLVVEETGWVKQGRKSVGVARQYSGTAGRIANGQIGGFLGYASAHGRTFLDRAWYLPQTWAAAGPRRTAAGVPDEGLFPTKPQLARQMLTRALAAGGPWSGLSGDAVYGSDGRMRTWLEEHRINYGLGVTVQYRLCTGYAREWAATGVRRWPAAAWPRCSCGAGSTGERYDDWVRLPLRPRAGSAHGGGEPGGASVIPPRWPTRWCQAHAPPPWRQWLRCLAPGGRSQSAVRRRRERSEWIHMRYGAGMAGIGTLRWRSWCLPI
jgi:hypothetical protein